MPGVEQAKQIWGYAVPQEAFKYKFLMHAILAFAAIHLGHLEPARSTHYQMLGSTHQTAAVTGINEEISPDNVTSENCHALFASASLIILNAFADAGPQDLDALIDIFVLCRGTNTILQQTEATIQRGPFAPILRPTANPARPPALLATFLVDIQTLAAGPQLNSPGSDSSAAELLREALQFGIENSPHPSLRAVMLWPMRISPECLEALRVRKDPDVVTVFRQYCRILEYAGTEWWFLSRWRNVSEQFRAGS